MDHEKDFRKDELLEVLWHLDERHDLTITSLREHDPSGLYENDLRELSFNGILTLDADEIKLTEGGKSLARGIIRRHRLAERLLVDVLGKSPDETEQAACEFEHVIAPEVVESICTLLGHPKTCPHGSVIPEGSCCRESRRSFESLVIPLSELKNGETAKVISINTDVETRIDKLLSIGIVPGVMVRALQKKPALVLEVNQTRIALETSIGSAINVWRPVSAR